MKFSTVIVAFAANVLAAPSLIARDGGKFGEGQPIDADGKGGPIQGMLFRGTYLKPFSNTAQEGLTTRSMLPTKITWDVKPQTMASSPT